jgi:hypothetical protein
MTFPRALATLPALRVKVGGETGFQSALQRMQGLHSLKNERISRDVA